MFITMLQVLFFLFPPGSAHIHTRMWPMWAHATFNYNTTNEKL